MLFLVCDPMVFFPLTSPWLSPGRSWHQIPAGEEGKQGGVRKHSILAHREREKKKAKHVEKLLEKSPPKNEKANSERAQPPPRSQYLEAGDDARCTRGALSRRGVAIGEIFNHVGVIVWGRQCRHGGQRVPTAAASPLP